jgi:hypothetical protein
VPAPAHRLLVVSAAILLVVAGSLRLVHGRADAQVPGFRLVALCDAPDALRAGLRSFRVENGTGVAAAIELRNRNSGAAVTGTAPPGASFWQVQGVNGTRNTTDLFVSGQFAEAKNSLNRSCIALNGNAECDPASGIVTVSWTLTNFSTLPVTVVANSLGLTFAPNPTPPGGLGGVRATATEILPGASTASTRGLTLDVDLGRGARATVTSSVTLPPCEQPLPNELTFTFTKTASASTAEVGQTITYTYAGTNTSAIAIEVVQLVDDRLGILIEEPQATLVAPGASISRSVDYVVQPTDAGTTIENNAVVSVLDPASGRTAQGVAVAHVTIGLPPDPGAPPTTLPAVEPSTAPTTPAAQSATSSPAAGPARLPSTGSGPNALLPAGVLAIALGVALFAVSRGRARRIEDP